MYRESKHIWQEHFDNPIEHSATVVLDETDIQDTTEARAQIEKHFHFGTYNSYLLGYLSRVRLFRDVLKPLFDLMNIFVYLFKLVFKRNYRIVDKNPSNCFTVDYLAKAFPDAKFIYITRDGNVNTSSLMNAWSDHKRFPFKFRKYLTAGKQMNIQGYDGDVWKFAFPPGWEEYLDKSLAEVCAFQWASAHQYSLEAFAKMDSSRYMQVKFEDLLAAPDELMTKVCDFVEIDYNAKLRKIVQDMPLVNTSSKPSESKVSRNQEAIKQVENYISPMQKRLGY